MITAARAVVYQQRLEMADENDDISAAAMYDHSMGGPACDPIPSATDSSRIQTWINGPTYKVIADLDLDGDVDATDKTIATSNIGLAGGWGLLSRPMSNGGDVGGNRKGYAGYEFDAVLAHSMWHVRHRVLDSDLGRWTRRDPLPSSGGIDQYSFVNARTFARVDPYGLEGETPHQPHPWVAGCAKDADNWNECMICCAYYFGPHDPDGYTCADNCNNRFAPQPSPPQKPFVHPCYEVTPVPPGAICDRTYGPCETYLGANARCFCRCMGSDPWSDYVRACLACAYKKGWDPEFAHKECFEEATRRYYEHHPGPRLAKCACICWAYQLAYCVV